MISDSAVLSDDSQDRFSIRSIEPYSLDTTEQASVWYGDDDIVRLACRCNTSANLIQRFPDASSRQICSNEQTRHCLVETIRAGTASKLRVDTAAQALKLHFGIAATLYARELLTRTSQELQRQREVQQKLIGLGVSVPDALLVERLQVTWNDQNLDNRSKEQSLRLQMSGIIGKSNACSYLPKTEESLSPSDIDVCEYVSRARLCRGDLQLLHQVRSYLNQDSLSWWDEVTASLIGVPSFDTYDPSFFSRVRALFRHKELDAELCKRLAWLDCLIVERTNQAQIEVEVAYEKKRTAALRWSNAKEQLSNWDARIQQLERLGEAVQGNLAELANARLQRLQSESQLIERWLDWHLANVELQQATGDLDCKKNQAPAAGSRWSLE